MKNNSVPTISCIVPIYNCEKYLDKCVESILNQTFDDFEVILINDGSNDCSGEICDKFSKKDSRIKVIHKLNEGVSKTRNLGIEKSIGKWICFIDSDDYVEEFFFEKMLSDVKPETDLIISGFSIYENNSLIRAVSVKNAFITDKKQFMDFFVTERKKNIGVLNVPFGKFYSKDIIRNVRFNPEVSMGEDYLFNLQVYDSCKNIIICDKISYCYQLNPYSATKNFSEQKLYNQIKMIEESNDYLEKNNCSRFSGYIFAGNVICGTLKTLIFSETQYSEFKKKLEILQKIKGPILFSSIFSSGWVKKFIFLFFFRLRLYFFLFSLKKIGL